jgi:hypothetical protein
VEEKHINPETETNTQSNSNSSSNNNNFFSIQFFIIYVPSQQPQGQLQAQHSVDKIIIT